MTATISTLASEAELLAESQDALRMALEAGANDAVASVSEGRGTSYTYRDGAIEMVKNSATRILTVQLHVDGRFSGHSSNDLRPKTLQSFLADAVALTRALEPDPHRQLPDPARYEGRSEADLDLEDTAVRAFSREQALDWLREMDTVAHQDERVISSTSDWSAHEGAMGRTSSNGFEGTVGGTSISTYTDVTVKDAGDKRPESYAWAAARHLADLPAPDTIAAKALERALARLGSAKGQSARTTLVVHREAAQGLLGRMFGALNGASIQQGRSFLAEKLDQQIAAPILTVVDDPLVVRGLGSHAFDGEGLAAIARPVIEDGILKTFFVGTYYARKLGVEPTTGSTSNIRFGLGNKDASGLIGDVTRGIYVTDWAGGNADSTNGDFSFGLRGYRIENGQIGAPVSEMNVTGNYLTLLESLSAIGNDPFPYSSFAVPTLVFENVQVSGS